MKLIPSDINLFFERAIFAELDDIRYEKYYMLFKSNVIGNLEIETNIDLCTELGDKIWDN